MTRVTLRERKKRETRERIVTAAAKLFAQSGIDRVTVDQIASAAEVGKGTVYNYFNAKEDIVVALLVALDRRALQRMPKLAETACSPAEALDAAAWSLLANKAEHRDFVKAFFARMVEADGFAADLTGFQQLLDAALHGLFKALSERFDLPAGAMRPDEFVLSFKTMHVGLSVLWILEGPPYSAVRSLARQHMALLAKGLEP